MSWDRLHPRLTRRAAWLDHDGPLPVIDGALIRLQVEYLPATATPSRSGCRPRPPAQAALTSTGSGRRSCADSTSNTFFRLFKSPVQTDPRVAHPGNPQTRGRRPVDLAHHRHTHPAPARPPPHRRPPAALGTPRRTRPTHPPHASAAACGTSVRPSAARPAHQNPPNRALADRPGSKNKRPAPIHDVGKTTKKPSPPSSGRQLKDQAE